MKPSDIIWIFGIGFFLIMGLGTFYVQTSLSYGDPNMINFLGVTNESEMNDILQGTYDIHTGGEIKEGGTEGVYSTGWIQFAYNVFSGRYTQIALQTITGMLLLMDIPIPLWFAGLLQTIVMFAVMIGLVMLVRGLVDL